MVDEAMRPILPRDLLVPGICTGLRAAFAGIYPGLVRWCYVRSIEVPHFKPWNISVDISRRTEQGQLQIKLKCPLKSITGSSFLLVAMLI